MAFKHDDYTLYARTVETKNGRASRVYFFAKRKPEHGQPADLPEGFDVTVEPHTGIPRLTAATGKTTRGGQATKKAAAKKAPKKAARKKPAAKKAAAKKAPAKTATPAKKPAKSASREARAQRARKKAADKKPRKSGGK